jgi:integrase
MGSIFARGSKLYAKVKNVAGVWTQVATGFSIGDETAAASWVAELEARVAAQRDPVAPSHAVGALTVRAYAERWLAERKVETVDDDRGRLHNHILPGLGDLVLAELRPRQVRDFVKALAGKRKLGNRRKDGTRAPCDEPIAPRTVRHVYGTLRAMLNDAVADELITTNPCVLKDELPAKVDKDRTWRRTAVFTRDEVQTIISAPPTAIPEDRLVLYALEFLGAMRFGEAAALTWSDYDPASSPLGKLVIERSYSSKARRVKETKTDNPREMPVHPTLARILAAWKLGGFERMTGRAPRPEDLIVPSRRGRPRNANHALRRFHEDLDRIGLRARRQHDARRTFISIARADGARTDILRWATHGPTGDITDQYTTLPWAALCEEVAKLRIEVLEGELVWLPLAAGADGLGAAVVQSSNQAISGEKMAERTGLEPWQRNPRLAIISRSCNDHAGLRRASFPARPS